LKILLQRVTRDAPDVSTALPCGAHVLRRSTQCPIHLNTACNAVLALDHPFTAISAHHQRSTPADGSLRDALGGFGIGL